MPLNSSNQPILSCISTDKTYTLVKVRLTSSQTLAVDIFYKNNTLATTLYCDNNLIKPNIPLLVSISIDGHSGVLSAMINGILCNGVASSHAGWAIVPQNFNFSNISNTVHLYKFTGTATKLQIYNTPFTTSQMVEEYLAWKTD